MKRIAVALMIAACLLLAGCDVGIRPVGSGGTPQPPGPPTRQPIETVRPQESVIQTPPAQPELTPVPEPTKAPAAPTPKVPGAREPVTSPIFLWPAGPIVLAMFLYWLVAEWWLGPKHIDIPVTEYETADHVRVKVGARLFVNRGTGIDSVQRNLWSARGRAGSQLVQPTVTALTIAIGRRTYDDLKANLMPVAKTVLQDPSLLRRTVAVGMEADGLSFTVPEPDATEQEAVLFRRKSGMLGAGLREAQEQYGLRRYTITPEDFRTLSGTLDDRGRIDVIDRNAHDFIQMIGDFLNALLHLLGG